MQTLTKLKLFLGHPVIRINPASYYCTILCNTSLLNLRARGRTLGHFLGIYAHADGPSGIFSEFTRTPVTLRGRGCLLDKSATSAGAVGECGANH